MRRRTISVDIFTQLTSADITKLNADVRAYDPGPVERAEIAQVLKVTPRTVERYFTTAGQQRGLVPPAAKGKRAYGASGALSHNDNLRLLLALTLTGQIKGEKTTGKEKTARTARVYLVDAVARVSDQINDKWEGWKTRGMVVEKAPNGNWEISITSAAMDKADNTPQSLQDEQDDQDEEDEILED